MSVDAHNRDYYEKTYLIDFVETLHVDHTVGAIRSSVRDIDLNKMIAENKEIIQKLLRYSKELTLRLTQNRCEHKLRLMLIDIFFIYISIISTINKYSDENTGYCNLSPFEMVSLQCVYNMISGSGVVAESNTDLIRDVIRYIQYFFVQSSDLID